MGSWSHSLHVKHADPQAVIDAIQALLGDSGFQIQAARERPAAVAGKPTSPAPGRGRHASLADDEDDSDGAPDEHDFTNDEYEADDYDGDDGEGGGDGSGIRKIAVFRAVRGWVGVLDSDFEGIVALAEQLSDRLRTDTMFVYVNDSDSWGYALYRQGRSFDEFDSSGDTSGSDSEISPELQAAVDGGDEEEIEAILERETLAYAPKGPLKMPGGFELMPPHIVRIQERMARGTATLIERWQYRWWFLKFLLRMVGGRLNADDFDGADIGFDIPPARPLDPADLERHLDRLAEFFPGADRKALATLLPKCRFPSEELLVEFMKSVGLPGLYGHLNYRYQRDFSDGEMADEGMVRVADLEFTPRGGGG